MVKGRAINRQLFADITMKNYKIKTSCVSPEGLEARSKKNVINFMTFNLVFVENCLLFNAMQDFSVWLRTGSNPSDINWF